MFYVLQNESTAARRRVPILLTDAATGTTAQVGVATTTIFPYVAINGNAFIGGTGSLGEAGFGQYYYEFEANEVATLGLAGIHITAAGCRDYDAIAQIAAFDLYSASTGASAYAIAQEVWNTDVSVFSVPQAGGALFDTYTPVSNYLDANVGDVQTQVWNFDISSRTDPSAGFNLYQLGIGATGYAAGGGITAGDVWEYDISSISTAGTAGSQLNLSAIPAGAGISAYDVWQYPIPLSGQTAEDSLGNAVNFASSAESQATTAANQTVDIAGQVWGNDITSGANTPYLAGTAGTILYTLGQAGVALTAGDVWDYATRTITGGIADTVTLVSSPVEISYPSMAGVANTIWSTDVSGYTNPSAGYDLTQAASGGLGLTAGDVWEYDISGILTAGSSGKQLNTAATPSGAGISAYDVWDFNITGFGATNSAAVYVTDTNFIVGNIETYVSTQTPQDVWTYAGIEGRTITGGLADTVTSLTNPANVTTSSMAGVANTVWSTLTAPYTTHATFGHQILRSDNAATIGEVTLHQSGGSKRVDADVHAFVNNTASATAMLNILTGIGASITSNITGSLSGSVGSVTNPVDITSASMTGIAGTVWNTDVSGFTSPSAGYDLANVSAGGGISAYDVWSFDYVNAPGGVVPVSAAERLEQTRTESYAASNNTVDISGQVWNTDVSAFTSPSAGYDLTQAASGAGLTSGDVSVAVWDSPVASYTSSGTFGLNVLRSDIAGVAGTVSLWTGGAYSGIFADTYRIDADYNAAIALKDILTGIGASITGNITGDLSGSVGSVTADVNVSTASMTGIAGTVWSTDISGYTSPSAGYSLYNATGGVGLTAGDVWSYATRTVTGGAIDNANVSSIGLTALASIGQSIWRFDVDSQIPVYGSGEAGFHLQYPGVQVWSQTMSNLLSAEANLVQAAAGSGLTVGDVWSAPSRTITGGIADTVTTLTDRAGFAITGGTITTVSDKTGYSLSGTQAFNLTGNITGNLSGSVGSVSGNVSGSVASVVGNVGGNVTGSVGSVSGNVGGNVVGSVDSVTNPVTFVNTQYAAIASSVWNAGTRTLTSGGSGISAYDVWNFDPTAMTVPQAGAILTDIQTDTNQIQTDISNIPNNVWVSDVSGYTNPGEAGFELSQAAAGAGLTAGDVWTYGTRTITGGIADTVTTVSNGVIVTTNNDKTGYALSGAGVSAVQSGLSTLTQAQVGTEVDSSLLDVGLTSAVTGRIDASVSSRLASASYVAPPTEAAIAGTVWGYATRTLTSGGGITAGDVWTYGTRSLTSGAGITVNAATNIINGPYFVKSNVDGQDGNLDVIRGMVQDIQLTVTDAFQNPFDVTALGLAVNFYDQAGTLVTSYGTSNLYAPAGLVQFTLDTAVTGTEGRYNLILSAAGSGNTIKFGPLTTLVRPF